MIAWAAIAIVALTSSPELREWPGAGGFEVVQLDDGCAVTAEYPLAGRSPLTLTVFYGGQTGLAITSSDWSTREGEKYTLTFLLGERGFTGEVTGLASPTAQKGFVATFEDSFIDAFAAAPSMFVTRGDAVVAHLNLRGTSAAVAMLRRCRAYVQRENAAQTARERRLDYIASDPFAPAASDPAASSSPPRPHVITNVSWSRRPRVDFPERALALGLTSGSATVECLANSNGRVSDCKIVSESPTDAGFGQAAIVGAELGLLSPRTVDGVGGGARFTFRTAFSLD